MPYYNTPQPTYSHNPAYASSSRQSPTNANSLLGRIGSPAGSPASYPRPAPPIAAPAPANAEQDNSEDMEVDSGDVALPSEETVDAFLASVLTTDVVASHLQVPSAPASQSPVPPPPATSRPGPTPPSLLSSTQEAERRAHELVTDEWCEEMIAHARRAREEMRKRAGEGREGKDVAANEEKNVGENAEDVVMEDADVCAQGVGTTEHAVESGQVPEKQPHPPGETMLDSAARVLQGFLANSPRPPGSMRREVSGHSAQAAESSQAAAAGPSTAVEPTPAAQAATSTAGVTAALGTDSGLWALRVGSRVPEIATITFNVRDSVACAVQRWALRYNEFDDSKTQISVHLLCLPALAVAEANSSLGTSAQPDAVSDALKSIPTQWPPKGTLVIEVNGSDAKHARTFLPTHLDAIGGAVDLTAHIRPGANTVRLIQLRDLSEWVFVVHAGAPSDDERAEFAVPGTDAREWAAFVARASANHGAIESTPMAMTVSPV
ncbi:uncharacterized protein B0H18DRAFT_1000931 [Fomitopsis serialis]|uniref:uncharacterized protein n=1 Tax=Fomitopsis serialis TaxID=139415 RepID=UPI002008154E|nr:uncharacterized protein B0H18DRAFT_1000931 [Neoantrodia serialis]KAH9928355.1 hypothetical protein B0H18DRAFT_1000931 [Neoantrodia serialis]